MLLLGLPCDICGMPTTPHCGDGECKWSRCPKCHSYGIPGQNWVEWKKDDYRNPYTLLDVEVAEPERTMNGWLEEAYGERRFDGDKW